jgi:hypothetical protein
LKSNDCLIKVFNHGGGDVGPAQQVCGQRTSRVTQRDAAPYYIRYLVCAYTLITLGSVTMWYRHPVGWFSVDAWWGTHAPHGLIR